MANQKNSKGWEEKDPTEKASYVIGVGFAGVLVLGLSAVVIATIVKLIQSILGI